MIDSTIKPMRRVPGPQLGKMPLPHEHGAWVILYAPLLIGLAAAWPPSLASTLLLTMAVTGIYLAQNAAHIWLRQRARGDQNTLPWLLIFVLVAALGGLPLLVLGNGGALLALAFGAGMIYVVHAVVSKLPMRNKLWRAQWSEMVGMMALTLTAPAAFIASGGALDGMALCLWVACVLFFGSGVLHVRMQLFASKEKQPLTDRDRLRLGWANLLYHALLMVAVAVSVSHLGQRPALLVWLGFVPILVRAVDGTLTLSHIAPSFKKVGIVETGYALWFTLCFIAALHSW